MRYKSGSSVRGKTRVSEHARKRLKSLFHLAGRPVPSDVNYLHQSRAAGAENFKIIISVRLVNRAPGGGKNKIRTADAAGLKRGSQ